MLHVVDDKPHLFLSWEYSVALEFQGKANNIVNKPAYAAQPWEAFLAQITKLEIQIFKFFYI